MAKLRQRPIKKKNNIPTTNCTVVLNKLSDAQMSQLCEANSCNWVSRRSINDDKMNKKCKHLESKLAEQASKIVRMNGEINDLKEQLAEIREDGESKTSLTLNIVFDILTNIFCELPNGDEATTKITRLKKMYNNSYSDESGSEVFSTSISEHTEHHLPLCRPTTSVHDNSNSIGLNFLNPSWLYADGMQLDTISQTYDGFMQHNNNAANSNGTGEIGSTSTPTNIDVRRLANHVVGIATEKPLAIADNVDGQPPLTNKDNGAAHQANKEDATNNNRLTLTPVTSSDAVYCNGSLLMKSLRNWSLLEEVINGDNQNNFRICNFSDKPHTDVEAIFSFKAEYEDEIGFEAGRHFHLISNKHKDWWMGEIDGKKGLFPAAFVKLINSAPINRKSKPPAPSAIPHTNNNKISTKYNSLDTVFLPLQPSEYHRSIHVIVHNDNSVTLNLEETKALIMLKLNSVFVDTCKFHNITPLNTQYQNNLILKSEFVVKLEFPLPVNFLLCLKNIRVNDLKVGTVPSQVLNLLQFFRTQQ